MKAHPRFPRSIGFLLAMTVLCGLAYPALVTAVAGLAFPWRSGGSQMRVDGVVRGSYLLAQDFSSPRFFRSRPSAAGYAAVGAGASNLGPTSADLAAAVEGRRAAWLRSFGPPVPEEMLYASASGVDPDISLGAALAQVGPVASARHLDRWAEDRLADAARRAASSRGSLLDPPVVNVVALNALLESDPAFGGKRR